MTSFFTLYIIGVLLVLVQVLAALPWVLLLLDRWRQIRERRFLVALITNVVVIVAVGGLGPALRMKIVQERSSLQTDGCGYAAVLHLQLTLDFFVFAFGLLMVVWPKGAAVALAAFREGWRQPMFWLILTMTLLFFLISPYIPYFTFGEDVKMFKELGYDVLMLSAALFAVLAASMSISEEIEGRTAITLMSKPVSRRQFLVGKFLGILLAALLMTGVLNWVFDGMMLHKGYNVDRESLPALDQLDAWTADWTERWGEVPAYVARGAAFWAEHVVSLLPGVVLGFCQVMVLLAIAVALATRLPMIVNLVICLVIFFLGRLTPILEQVSQGT